MKACGKVNLGLDVIGKRKDGYHLVRMIMQTVNICDEVTLDAEEDCSKAGEILITCDHPEVPTDSRNLAYRAAELISRQYHIESRIRIDIRKRIPMAAGMAGGSADAAAVIRGMDQCFHLGMTPDEQDRIAVSLGADVPFCLRKGTWLAEGIGEQLTKVPDLAHCFMIIVKPGFGVSTPWAYRELDVLTAVPDSSIKHPDIDGLIDALGRTDIQGIASCMGNILEAAVIRAYPEIQDIKNRLVSLGAVRAIMSGSGPTVFGIFESTEQAEFAFSHLEGGDQYDKFKVEF